MSASSPVVIASNQSAVPVSGTVGISGTVPVSGSVTVSGTVAVSSIGAGSANIGSVSFGPATSGGLSVYERVSSVGTNPVSIKASAGQLYGYYIYNSSASPRKLVFHNTGSTPTAGSGVFISMVIPPTSAANASFDMGIAFSSGIGITMVTGLPDADGTGVAANDLIINIYYK